MDPNKVLVMHHTGKKVEFWPHVPYDVVPHPYVLGVYNKEACLGKFGMRCSLSG